MIDCKECVEYAHSVLARGEITIEDVNKLALDRHILKGCANVYPIHCVPWDSSKIPMDINVNGFNMKDVIKDVMFQYDYFDHNHDIVEEIAEKIKEEFAIKLRLKQG